jgi:exosortase/archaeosortase family protein
LALVPLFVVLCYQFEWRALRSVVCSAFLAILHAAAVPALQISPDGLIWRGQVYQFVVACTAVDAYCGSVPLLWMVEKSVPRNLVFFSVYFVVLSVVNVIRIAAGFLAFVGGVSWWLSHEVVAGVFYFFLFLWIARRRGWSLAAAKASAPAAS